MAIWNILPTFGIFYDIMYGIFFWFWYRAPRKIWQPWSAAENKGVNVRNISFFCRQYLPDSTIPQGLAKQAEP
jgi:hypothetical protein